MTRTAERRRPAIETPEAPEESPGVRPIFRDTFADARGPGGVIGSAAPNGPIRRGRDLDGCMSTDSGGLRITAPRRPGFGRHALWYGPVEREPGTLLVADVLNGHNASQTALLDSRRPVRDAILRVAWRLRGAIRRLVEGPLRRAGWRGRPPRFDAGHFRFPSIRENLAVGFVDGSRKPQRGHAFIMRSANHEGGHLHVVSGSQLLPVRHGVQNVPIRYAVLLRSKGAVYYATSLRGVPGMAEPPFLRPLALDPNGDARTVAATIDQGILGEINFSVDTRVFDVQAAVVPAWSRWYGSAHAADTLRGCGTIDGSSAEIGGRWHVAQGVSSSRTTRGLETSGKRTLVVVRPTAPTALLHVTLEAIAGAPRAGIVLRSSASGPAVVLSMGPNGARLDRISGRLVEPITDEPSFRLRRGRAHSLQVMDDGRRITAALDGKPIFPRPIHLGDSVDALGVGLFADGRGRVRFEDFEAHPRDVRLDEALLGETPWWTPPATKVHAVDDFIGAPGDLADESAGSARHRWERTFGKGRIERSGEGSARVPATPSSPNDGRTLYTIPWPDPKLADVEVEITPPGSARGEGQLVRGGLTIWQDEENYLVVNAWNDDMFPGSSVSSFLKSRGSEDLFRAVWTNVGARVRRGVPFRMRLISDGLHYLVLLNDEPVLYRAFTDIDPAATRLAIRRAGVAVNWEFGDDTGTLFRRFVARTARPVAQPRAT
jgi:hypothetical protein